MTRLSPVKTCDGSAGMIKALTCRPSTGGLNHER
jgi:hypothetical protein